MRTIAIALIFLSSGVNAGDFSARVAAGNKAIATPEGKAYDAALVPAIQSAMLACVPPGSSPKESLGEFALVGYCRSKGMDGLRRLSREYCGQPVA